MRKPGLSYLSSKVDPDLSWLYVQGNFALFATFLNRAKLILEGVHQWEFAIPLEN